MCKFCGKFYDDNNKIIRKLICYRDTLYRLTCMIISLYAIVMKLFPEKLLCKQTIEILMSSGFKKKDF